MLVVVLGTAELPCQYTADEIVRLFLAVGANAVFFLRYVNSYSAHF